MIHKPRLRHLGRALAFAALFATAAARGAFGQAVPETKPGEIILYMQPGTPVGVANALAAKVNPASVTPLLLADCYVIELPTVRATAADTAAAVSTLKMDPNVRWVNASRIYRTHQISAAPKVVPNDPLFGNQWGLTQINMPQAWVLQKGAANVNVAWIDSGYATKHEDAVGQYLADSYNFVTNSPNIEAAGSVLDANEDGHGIGTSGVAIALTNNQKGVAGIDWTNTKCLALKVKADTVAYLDGPAILNSYAYIMQKKSVDHIVVVNMSYGANGADPGGSGGTDPEFVATKQLADAGVLMVASAGNSGSAGNPTSVPADYPHIISVSAIDKNGKKTAYSSFGKVEIAAPGGDNADTGIDADGINIIDYNNTYIFASGTSYSAPHVSAVLALMMSVPGVTSAQAKAAMYSTANRNGLSLASLPDPMYGYGILDAYAALLKVSVSVVIDDPIGIDANGASTDPSGLPPPPTETLQPTLRFKVSNVPLANLTITIDPGTADQKVLTSAQLQYDVESGNPTAANPQYVISFRLKFKPQAPFTHKIVISGTNPTSGLTATDTRTFTIQSHIIPAGLSMISIPYLESATDSPTGAIRDADQLLSSAVTLHRYLFVPGKDSNGNSAQIPHYVDFGFGVTAPSVDASLHPATFQPTAGDTNTPQSVAPLGVGYFINAPVAIPVVTYGQSFDTTAFRIPLHEGWNMIGNPYRFTIPFDGLEFEDLSGNRLTAEVAADQKLILPFIYRYVGSQYQFEQLPAGNLQAWEGQWIYVVPKNPNSLRTVPVLTMITTPVAVSGFAGRSVKATRSLHAAVTTASLNTPPKSTTSAGGWTVQLEASSNDLHDSYNYVGVTRSAAVSARSLAPKPPHPSPYVTLGVARPENKNVLYAQDLQLAGGAKTWNVAVQTDQPNTDITLKWPNVSTVPKGYSLTLRDAATGQVINLRNQASYRFNSGHDAATRAFVLMAQPTNSGGRAVLTNIVVNPPRTAGGRAAGAYDIGYTVSQDASVEVSIMGYNGQTIARIGATRAASSGDNHQSWNGKDAKGSSVPAGTYLLQFRAISTDGTVTREIRPLTITGR